MKLSSSMLLSLVMAVAGGCSSTQEIETSRPRTPETPAATDGEDTRQARIAISLQQGESLLHEDIEALEFRISEVQVHRADGGWIRLPSDMNTFELSRRREGPPRSVLNTNVAPAAYDSVAVAFDSIYARFNANAGAPLTAASAEPLRLALALNLSRESTTSVVLVFEPEASLRQTPDCRWFFLPLIRPEVR